MISTKNPFPGMNPFFERNWPSVHTTLISFIWQEISDQLPDDLITRPEEQLVIDELDKTYRADLGVTELWEQGAAPSWKPTVGAAEEGVVIAEPQILRVEERMERWIEIRAVDGRLVTVIELLSPANKDTGRERYKNKQAGLLSTTANLVEIDLLRSGRFTLPVSVSKIRKPTGTCYFIGVNRAARPDEREIYCCPLRERLPAVRLPLRPTDPDLVLDLQPIIDRCYEMGRYYKGRFDEIPDPPFPPEEATWVEECLRNAGLRR